MKTVLKKIINQNSGMSLVGVIVGIGILGVLTVIFTELISNTLKSQSFIERKALSEQKKLGMLGLLSDRSMCELNFRGLVVQASGTPPATPPKTPVANVYTQKTPDIFFMETGDLIEGKLVVQSMYLSDYRARASTGVDRYRGGATLTLVFSEPGTAAGRRFFGRNINLSLELNGHDATYIGPDDEIYSCVAIGNDQDDIWTLATNGTDIYYNATSANVGINTTVPVRTLHVNGQVLAESYYHISDERLKKNIQRVQKSDLEKLSHVKGYHYRWKESNNADTGVIAQQVEKYFPNMIFTNPDGTKTVAYSNFIPLLIESNANLRKRIEALETVQKK